MDGATIGFIVVGFASSLTTVIVALIQHSKNKDALELETKHQTKTIDLKLDGMNKNFDLKLAALESKVQGIREDVKCVEEKIDKNIQETGAIKVKVVALEKDVEMLKGKGVKYANR